jgi:DNA-binding response OmpR family regulator
MSKILIVEDERDLRENIIELFESQAFEVNGAENGEIAYELAVQTKPDLIISDVIMPEADGFELLERLRRNPNTELIPVILLTAKTMLDSRIHGLQLGADDYINKPFSADELLIRANNLIEKQKRLVRKAMISPGEIEAESKNEVLVKKIIQIIEARMSDYNLSVDLIASEIGISKSTIQRKLKTTINKNLNELIREYRLEKARKMIEKKTGTLSDIAATTGFNSLSYFSYSYKKFFGIAPSQEKS